MYAIYLLVIYILKRLCCQAPQQVIYEVPHAPIAHNLEEIPDIDSGKFTYIHNLFLNSISTEPFNQSEGCTMYGAHITTHP
jgi:hypothetical protein